MVQEWKGHLRVFPEVSPLRKRGVFCLLGWKNLHGCDICKSTGKRNPFTPVSYNNLQKLALERQQNSKDHILSISDLKLRKSFQATVSNAKKNIIHTYIHTYLYFIYARNFQSSCRANVFEKISYNKIKYAILQFQYYL